jgi:hypothetical protein
MNPIKIGRLLRSSNTGCVVGCRVTDLDAPAFGSLVCVPVDPFKIFGLIFDMHVDDDGLVRQLATTEHVAEEVIMDNRMNRNVPVEISVLFVGYQKSGVIYHTLPPRPPLVLDVISTCSDEDAVSFTGSGRFGYFRHILRAADIPVGELIAAHLQQIQPLQESVGQVDWAANAARELITLLRDDYPTLMAVLGAISELHFPVAA